MSRLIVQAGGNEKVIELKRAVTSIGRDETNDIRIGDPSVSSRHCRIEKTDDGYVAIDLGGRNGTLINGKKIKEHRLEPQDKIEVGRTAMYFESLPRPLECCVQILNGAQKGKDFDLTEEISTLGRNQSCAIILHDDSVSNFHAAIERRGSRFVIRDLHSRNGTSVTGKEVGERPVALPDGCTFHLGNSKLAFRELVPIEGVAPPQRAPAPAPKPAAGPSRAPARPAPAAAAAAPEEEEEELRRPVRPKKRGGAMKIVGPLVVVGLVVGIVYAFLHLEIGSIGKKSTPKGGSDLLQGRGAFAAGEGQPDPKSHWAFRGAGKEGWQVTEGALVAPGIKSSEVAEAVCDVVVPVDKSKVYTPSCKLKAAGDHGLAGLKITWRSKSDPAYVLESFTELVAGKNDWRDVTAALIPPDEATELQLSCVTIGNPEPVHFHTVALDTTPRPGYMGDEGGYGQKMGVSFGDRGIIHVSRGGGLVLWDIGLRLETAEGAVIWQKHCKPQQKQPREYSSMLIDPVTLTPIDFHVMMQVAQGTGIILRHTVRARQKVDMKSIGISFLMRQSDIPHGVLLGENVEADVKEGPFNANNVDEAVLGHGKKRIVIQPQAPVEMMRRDEGEAARLTVWIPIEILEAEEEMPVEFYLKTSSRLADEEVKDMMEAAARSSRANEIGDAIRVYTQIMENPYFPEKSRQEAKKESGKLQQRVDKLLADTDASIEKLKAKPTKANETMVEKQLEELQIALAAERMERNGGEMVYEIVPQFRAAVEERVGKVQNIIANRDAAAQADIKKLFANAEKAITGESWMIARIFLENIIKKAPSSDEAKKARSLLDGLKKKEEKAKERTKKIETVVSRAKNYHRNKMSAEAIKMLQDVIKEYPGVPATKKAVDLLAKIKKDVKE